MDVEIRPISEDESPAYARAVEAPFGHQPSDAEVEAWRPMTELARTLAAFEGDEIVATAGAYTFELTTPGGIIMPAAGVSAVGVRPSHRRRGLLRQLMERQLDDVGRGEEAVAILTASESIIYGRFGYGAATFHASVTVDPRHAAFAHPLVDDGRMRALEPSQARRVAPAVHDQARRQQAGDISRSEAWWDMAVEDAEWGRPGEPPLFWAAHESPTGDADGYVAYRVDRRWPEGIPEAVVHVRELIATNAGAEAALWRYLFEHDLVGRVVAHSRPTDESVRWRLADPRRLRYSAINDHLWVRIVDIPAALSARRYAVDGELVFDISDPFRPSNEGRYLLRGGPDGAECAHTNATADIRLGVGELGSAYLGEARLSTLARAGRAVEQRVGSLARADRMFRGDVLPFCRTGF